MRPKTQKDVLDWAVSTWGAGARDKRERALRFLEEALELAQAAGLTLFEDVDKLLCRVYSRPPGEVHQEIAGVAITLASLAEVNGVIVGCAVDDEWARLESFPPGYLKAKHDAKVREGVASGETTMKLVRYRDLPEFGIEYSRTHLQTLIAAGKFPRPIKMGSSRNSAVRFVADEIKAHVDGFVAARGR